MFHSHLFWWCLRFLHGCFYLPSSIYSRSQMDSQEKREKTAKAAILPVSLASISLFIFESFFFWLFIHWQQVKSPATYSTFVILFVIAVVFICSLHHPFHRFAKSIAPLFDLSVPINIDFTLADRIE